MGLDPERARGVSGLMVIMGARGVGEKGRTVQSEEVSRQAFVSPRSSSVSFLGIISTGVGSYVT